MKTLLQRVLRTVWRERLVLLSILAVVLLMVIGVAINRVVMYDHYTSTPGIMFRLEKLVGSPIDPKNGFYGIFRLSNGTSRTLAIPVSDPNAFIKTLEAVKPICEIKAKNLDDWAEIHAVYDYFPETYNVKPWQQVRMKIRLYDLYSTAEDRGVHVRSDEIIHFPFYARVTLHTPHKNDIFISEPFLVTAGDGKSGEDDMKTTSATWRRD